MFETESTEGLTTGPVEFGIAFILTADTGTVVGKVDVELAPEIATEACVWSEVGLLALALVFVFVFVFVLPVILLLLLLLLENDVV